MSVDRNDDLILESTRSHYHQERIVAKSFIILLARFIVNWNQYVELCVFALRMCMCAFHSFLRWKKVEKCFLLFPEFFGLMHL